MKPLDFSEDHVDAILERMTIDDVFDYAVGIGRFLKRNLLSDEFNTLKYICTDVARKSFKYKDSNNIVQSDPKCVKLFEHIYDKIQKNINRIFAEVAYDDRYDELDQDCFREKSAEFSTHKLFRPALISAIASITIPKPSITTQKTITQE